MKPTYTCEHCTQLIKTKEEASSQNVCKDCASYLELDKVRLKKFIKKDGYVKFLFAELKKKGHRPDRALEILHTLIIEDGSLFTSYKML